MIDRYDTPDEALPHETTVLVVTQERTCFGRDFTALFDEIRSGNACDHLIIEEQYRSVDELPEYDTLIQYGVWVVHYSALLADDSDAIRSYLEDESIPDETQIVVVFDTNDDQLASDATKNLQGEYSDELVVTSTETELVYYLLGHFNTATPCTASGLAYLVSWNNMIADLIGPYRDTD